MFDILRAQNKDKIKQNLKYISPAADAILKEDLKIPRTQLSTHIDEYRDYPELRPLNKIEKNLPTSFGNVKRFKEPQFEFTQDAIHLSAIDYNGVFKYPDSAPTFEKYSKRKDNFLTKSQELLIQQKKDEAAQRMQRLQ